MNIVELRIKLGLAKQQLQSVLGFMAYLEKELKELDKE